MTFEQWLYQEYGLKPEAAKKASFHFNAVQDAWDRGYLQGSWNSMPSSDSSCYSNGPEGLDKG